MQGASIPPPRLLGATIERQVLRVIEARGAVSRAEVVRQSGLSAPTVSKAVATLLRWRLLEEFSVVETGRGRPAKRLRLARETAQVLGVVLDAGTCRVVSAGLDGALDEERQRTFATPGSYSGLLDAVAAHAEGLMTRPGVATLGVGISMPGMIDDRDQRGILSPNLPATDGHSPGLDLGRRLDLECVTLQEQHALCLAERHYGRAVDLDDFAMFDISTGVGLGVYSGGRLLRGHSGLAGEVGHITVVPDGPVCGCGNRGCLETVASDTALARAVAKRLRRKLDIDEVVRLARSGRIAFEAEVEDACRYLAIGLAVVINLFNPASLFVHGRLFDIDDRLFPSVIAQVSRRALAPSFADCRIVLARGSKRQGAVAGIIGHLTGAVVPRLESNRPVLATARGLAPAPEAI